MRSCPRLLLAGLAAAMLTACQPGDIPETRIGLNQPPPGAVQVVSWGEVAGASFYQVTVYLDRGATQPIGLGGLTSATHFPLDRLEWQAGHPVLDREYFWFVRAYDRPDPTGQLLASRGPNAITLDGAVAAPTPTPSP